MATRPRSILITGCSSGIGWACAQGLRARGWQVIATARRQDDVATLQAAGFTALTLDLNDSHTLREAVHTTLALTGGRLDALFNNAGFGLPGAVEDLTRSALRAQFETNLFGTVELINSILPHMRRQGYGRIVNNSSMLGLCALPYRGAYTASKYALEGLTDTLRLELHGSGIAVSLIEPGPILSRFRANSLAALQQHIDPSRSAHQAHYQAIIARLAHPGPAAPFTLPPTAVLKKLIHALESSRPRIRYYVTVPAHLYGRLRHLLPDRALDWVLRYTGSGGKR